MFENKMYEGIYYSRFAASYANACGKVGAKCSYRMMVGWLMNLTINGKKMDWKIASEIADFATNGKLELEESAKQWLCSNDYKVYRKKMIEELLEDED